MARDFFPRRDVDVVPWSKNFREKILEMGEAVGISPEEADHYGQLHEQFFVRFRENNNRGTRSTLTAVRKQVAREALEAEARRLSRVVHGSGATSAQKVLLGLSVRSGGGRHSLIGPPTTQPRLFVESVVQRRVTLYISDSDWDRRARPRGVAGAAVFVHVGDAPPTSKDWRFYGYATTRRYVVQFDASVPAGAKVYLAAHWLSTRLEIGPTSTMIHTNLQGGDAPVLVRLNARRRAVA